MTDEMKCFSSKQAVLLTTALSEMSCEISLQQLRDLFVMFMIDTKCD